MLDFYHAISSYLSYLLLRLLVLAFCIFIFCCLVFRYVGMSAPPHQRGIYTLPHAIHHIVRMNRRLSQYTNFLEIGLFPRVKMVNYRK